MGLKPWERPDKVDGRARWLAEGAAAITAKAAATPGLGDPTSPVAIKGSTVSQRFADAAIVCTPDHGAHVVRGAILARLDALGGVTSPLGAPTSDEIAEADGGAHSDFETGAIYWHPSTGAWDVYGAIYARWKELGLTKAFGYPTTGETATPDGGRFNHFSDNASIYFTPATGAHEVRAVTRSTWEKFGWERSFLGYPVAPPAADRQKFQGGAIFGGDAVPYATSISHTVHSGTIHLPGGTAANGWAELTLFASGYWTFRGEARATGAPSYDITMTMVPKYTDSEGHATAFTEQGDIEGSLVLGGNQVHSWEQHGSDPWIAKHYGNLAAAEVATTLKVDFGPGDVLAMVASILGIPGAIVGIAVAIAMADPDVCGGHDESGNAVAVFVPKGERCPVGTSKHPRKPNR